MYVEKAKQTDKQILQLTFHKFLPLYVRERTWDHASFKQQYMAYVEKFIYMDGAPFGCTSINHFVLLAVYYLHGFQLGIASHNR